MQPHDALPREPNPDEQPANPAHSEPDLALPEPAPLPQDAITARVPLAQPVVPKAAPELTWQGVLMRGLWGYVVPVLFFLSALVIVLYTAPALLHYWRISEAQADAEATYLKRRAELRAEAEHADQRLDLLDKRLHLASLGFREVVRKVSPLVVNVAHLVQPGQKEIDPFLQSTIVYDPEKNQKYLQTGVGSGVIVKPGLLLTNHHVVKNAHRLRVTFASGQSIGVDPSAVASDALTDLAVIRLPDDLPAGLQDDLKSTADFADSDKDVHRGDFALAIGSPLGLRQSVTQGVISAKGRLLNTLLVELLQTDAAIHPGNSGGPLFDHYGRVIGINVAIASDNGRNQGIGFAIPSNTARKIFEKLAEYGEVPRGYLGIAMDDLTGPRTKELGLEDGGGVLVTKTMPNQPAANAGLQTGDIIVRFEKELLSRAQPGRHLRQLIAEIEPDAEIRLEILRDGKREQIPITVGRRPADLP